MTPFAGALTDLARIALGASILWLTLATAAATVEAVGVRSRWSFRLGCPSWIRGIVIAVVGAVGLSSAPATAEPLTPPAVTDSVDGVVSGPIGLPLPERLPPSSPAAGQEATRADRPAGPLAVTVRPGDSLWSLVRQRLPPDRTNADVAQMVRRVHRANRAVIGADPDRIIPGQVLRWPAS